MSSLIAMSSITITDLNDMNISTTQPTNPAMNQLWLDTSISPNILKKWSGSAWINTGLTPEDMSEYVSDYVSGYVASRGEGLVTNGTGLIGDNTNFSLFTFDGSDSYSSSGSFKSNAIFASYMSDEIMPVDTDKTYRLSGFAKSSPYVVGNKQSLGVSEYDIDGNHIFSQHYMYVPGSLTTLAQDLKPGDTKVYLTSVSNWKNSVQGVSQNASFIFWTYKNAGGYLYPTETYSRYYTDKYPALWWNEGAINATEKSITLNSAWNYNNPNDAQGIWRAGTKLSNGNAGSTFKYCGGIAEANASWSPFTGTIGTIDTTGDNDLTKFSYGTAGVKLLFLVNHDNGAGNTVWWSNISFNIDLAEQVYVNNLAARLTTAELKVEPAAITSVVTQSETYKNDIGVNRWVVKRYNVMTLAGVAPDYTKIEQITPVQTVEYNDNISLDAAIMFGSSHINYIGVAFTNVYAISDFTLAVTVKNDDAARIYINGVSQYSSLNTNSVGTAASLNFIKGWNTVELMWSQQAGSEYIGLGVLISANLNIKSMACYKNVSGITETRVSSAEQKITPAAIVSTVRLSSEYEGDLAGKINTDGAEIVSYIEQTAASVMISASKIQLSGPTTFASWLDPNDTTKIDGSKLYTGSVKAVSIDTDSLSTKMLTSDNASIQTIFSGFLNTLKITATEGSIKTMNIGTLNGEKIALRAGSYEYHFDSQGVMIKDINGNSILQLSKYERNVNNIINFYNGSNVLIAFVEISTANNMYSVIHPIVGYRTSATKEDLALALGYGIFSGSDNKLYVMAGPGNPKDIMSQTAPNLVIDEDGLTSSNASGRLVRVDREGIRVSNNNGINWTSKLTADGLVVHDADIVDLSANKINAGQIDASKASIAGGDVLIDANGITINGTLGKGLKITTTAGQVITLDKDGLQSTNFKVNSNGTASFTGQITAATGAIGGWNIGTTSISKGTINLDSTAGLEKITMGATNNITLKADGSAIIGKLNVMTDGVIYTGAALGTYLFKVDATGKLWSTSADIGGWTVSSTKIAKGTAVVLDSSLSKITVSNGTKTISLDGTTGKLTADNVELTGMVTATSGKIGNWNIGANTLYSTNNIVTLDHSTELIVIKDGSASVQVQLGKYDATVGFEKYGLKAGSTIINSSGITATTGKIANWVLSDYILKAGVIELNATNGSEKITIGTNISLNVDGSAVIGKLNVTAAGQVFTGTTLGTYKMKIETDGKLYTNSAEIGGWVVAAGSISKTSGASSLTLDSTNNKIVVANATNNITLDAVTGKLTATSVDLIGKVTATSGKVGDWNIGTNLYSTNNVVTLDPATELITIKDRQATPVVQVVVGKYDATVGFEKYGLKAGSTIIDSSGIIATTGKIGGWTLNSLKMTASTVSIDATPGAEKITLIKDVNNSIVLDGVLGKLTANNVDIKGNILATTGNIGGWGVTAALINKGNINLDASRNEVWIGATYATAGIYLKNDGSAKLGKILIAADGSISSGGGFTITSAGAATFNGSVTSTSGAIGGWTLSATTLTGTNVAINSAGSISLGATSQVVLSAANGIAVATDKFTVDLTGKLTAKDAIITGAITATSGSFTGTMNASSGYFGTATDGVSINGTALEVIGAAGAIRVKDALNNVLVEMSAAGLVVNTGELKLGPIANGKYNFYANTSGISANAGTIGGWALTTSTLIAGNITLDSTLGSEKITLGTNISLKSDGSATIGKLSVQANGGLYVGTSDTVFSFKVDTAGKMWSNSADIGGWAVNSTSISKGTAVVLNSATSSIVVTSGTNVITLDGTLGKLSANNADISGKITASTGNIGGWEVTSALINKGNVNLDATNSAIWIGAAYATANISLKNDGSATLGKIAIATTGAISSAGNKFTIDASGNAAFNGTLTSVAGTLGGWTLLSTTLSDATTVLASRLVIDKTAQSVSVKSTDTYEEVRLGKKGASYGFFMNPNDDTTKPRLSLSQTGLSFQTYSALAWNDIFALNANGSATFAGTVASTAGSIGGWAIAPGGMSASNVNINSAGSITLGATNQLALSATTGINVGAGQFTVSLAGAMVAQSATITGTVNGTAGYFGTATNGVSIGATGLSVIGTGVITSGKTVIKSDRIIVNNASDVLQVTVGYNGTAYGITAGDATLTSSGLTINGSASSINLGVGKFVVTGAGAVTATSGAIGGWALATTGISAGNVQINAAGNIKLGATQQIVLDAVTGIKVATDKFTVSLAGAMVATSATVTGTINASAGTFTGPVTIGTGSVVKLDGTTGKITVNNTDVILDASGLTMSKGSISLGTKFAVTSLGVLTATDVILSGNITASSGAIGGWSLINNNLTSGNITLDSVSSKITIGTNVSLNNDGSATIGKMTVTNLGELTLGSGFSVDISGNVVMSGKVTATDGAIGGWKIATTSLASTNNVITLDNANEVITIKDQQVTPVIQVLVGKYAVGKYGVKAGNTTLDSAGITANQGTLGGWVLDATTIKSANITLDNALNKISVINGANTITLDGTNGKITANNVDLSGNINALTGTIGGWDITASTIKSTGSIITLDDTAKKIIISDGTTTQVTLGNYTGTSYGLQAGTNILDATGIKANQGTIGGWILAASTLKSGLITLDATAGLEKITIGTNIALNTNGSAKLGAILIATDGAITSTGGSFGITALGAATFNGGLTSISGTIGGWTLNNGFMSANNLKLDSAGNKITIINGANNITLDGANGKLTANNVDVSGKITSVEGTIGGWTLAAKTLSSGNIIINSTVGSEKISIIKDVNNSIILDSATGKLTANNVELAGKITASSGAIGGWDVTTALIKKGNINLDATNNEIWIGATYLTSNISLKSDGSAKLGAISITAAGAISSVGNKFSISAAGDASFNGSVTSTTGTIGGWSLTSGALTAGHIAINSTSDQISIVNGLNSILLDGVNGKLTANSVELTGKVTASSGAIGGWTINADANKTITSLNNRITLDPTAKLISITNDTAVEQVTIGNYTGTSYGIKAGSTTLDATGITANSGKIAGWDITAATIKKGNINLDSTNSAIWIGTAYATPSIALRSDGSAKIGAIAIAIDGAILSTGGNFSITAAGVATFAGSITSASGTIGGWSLNTGFISSGNMKLDSATNKITIINGANSITLDGANGKLTANNVEISGAITSTSGTIGGWTLASGNMYSGGLILNATTRQITATNGANSVVIDGALGSITANSGTIGGWTLGSSTLTSAGSIITLDTTNKLITIKDAQVTPVTQVQIGLYAAGKYGIKAGNTVLDASGLTTTQGHIGNWQINANTLTAGVITIDATAGLEKISLGTGIVLNATGSATLGKLNIQADGTLYTGTSYAAYSFKVDTAGKLWANSADLGGWTVNATTISKTNGLNVVTLDSASTKMTLTNGTNTITLDGALGKLTATDADISGKVTATSGKIANWIINGSTITAGNVVIDSTSGAERIRLVSGVNTITLDGATGKLTANNVDLTGAITASSGAIGGWDVTAALIKKGNINLDATNNEIWIGGTYATANISLKSTGAAKLGVLAIDATGAITSTNFGITAAGVATFNGTITAIAGTIGGWTLAAEGLSKANVQINSAGNIKLGVSQQLVLDAVSGIIVGSGATQFTVDLLGNVVAKSATVTGTVNATGGYFGNATNGVTVGATGLNVLGTGTIALGKTLIKNDRININNNLDALQVTLGYNGTAYGIFAGDTSLTSTGITINGSTSSINLGAGKFIVSSAGAITSTSGTIGGWTLAANLIKNTAGTINLDSTNNALWIGATYATAKISLKADGSATLGKIAIAADGSIASMNNKFTIDASGNAAFTGAITATSGSFTGAVTVGTAGAVVLDGVNKKITVNTTDVVLDANGLTIAKGSIALGSKFAVTTTGVLTASEVVISGAITATSGTFSGTVNATAGYFGGVSNKVTVDSEGLLLGTGRIADTYLNPKIKIDSTGILAKAGTLGSIILDDNGMTAGGTRITDQGIKVKGQKSIVIDDGSMTVKNEAGFEALNIGNNNGSYGMTVYGCAIATTARAGQTATVTVDGKAFTYAIATTAGERPKLNKIRITMTL